VPVLVDAANVVGSRPDGWWRDRAGAATRLLERLAAALGTGALSGPVVVVLEGAARAALVPAVPGLRVVLAAADGDAAIVEQAGALLATGGEPPVVVTADRGLRDRVASAGAEVRGPGWLLDRLG